MTSVDCKQCSKQADFESDSDSESGDDCCSKTPEPVKPGYERIYSKCGSYYDQIMAKDGEQRCDGCNCPFTVDNLQTDSANSHIKYVCNLCLDKGKVNRCKGCNTFIINLKLGGFFGALFGDQSYCDDCRPALVFAFNIKSPNPSVIEIPIPKGKESGLATNYFYEELAKQLNIAENQIAIKGLWPRAMVCAAEFEPKHKIFNVTVLENNCSCHSCDKCKHFEKEISYEYDENTKYGDWLWPGMN